MTERQPSRPPAHRPGGRESPLALDYETREVDPASRRSLRVAGTLLVIGWVPYLCGVLNGLVARRYPWSDNVVTAHAGSSLAFMTIGAMLSLIALIILIRSGQISVALIAAAVLIAQVSITLCLSVR